MQEIPFNLNQFVKIRPTKEGLKHLPTHMTPRKDGWYVLQLWEVMKAFGAVVERGKESPFEENMIFLTPEVVVNGEDKTA
jgi:hypothetical protein